MSGFDEDSLEKLRRSGRILRETREEIRNFVREGMPIIGVCEKAEGLIKAKGAKPAFPCNVSIDEIAAHYTSPPNCSKLIPDRTVVKVDIGAHIDGYLTDTAVTICFNPEHVSMVETAELAVKTAVENIKPEMPTSKLGALIEKTIKNHGFKPVSNLTGHQVGRFQVHAGISLPNVSHFFSSRIELGGVYAIEPFVTLPNAAGKVEDSEEATIFRFVKSRSSKSPHSRQLLEFIEKRFRTLPFAERWLQGVVPQESHREAFRELLASKALVEYPVFIEASRKPVAQAEHTVLIVRDGCEVLT